MFADLLGRDLHKYDLSSVEAGKRLEILAEFVF